MIPSIKYRDKIKATKHTDFMRIADILKMNMDATCENMQLNEEIFFIKFSNAK